MSGFLRHSSSDKFHVMSRSDILERRLAVLFSDRLSALADLIDTPAVTRADLLELKSALLECKATSMSNTENTMRSLELNVLALERKIIEANTGTTKSLIVVAFCLQTIVILMTFFAAIFCLLMRFSPSPSIN